MLKHWLKENKFILGILLFAFLLFTFKFKMLALSHWDEGPYTQFAKWLATFGKQGELVDPGYAPPFFTSLIALSYLFFGSKDYISFLPSIFSALGVIFMTYRFGKKYLNEKIGLIAAALLAVTPFLFEYARYALTDALFCLLFLSIMYFAYTSFSKEQLSWREAVILGILIGLAFNTKYSAFLTIIIPAIFFIIQFLRYKKWPYAEIFRFWGIIFGLAGLMYLPWFIAVERTLGYATMAADHLGHSLASGPLLKTPPMLILSIFRSHTSLLFMLAALAGLVLIITKLERPVHAFLVLVLFTYLFFAMLYENYDRLLLPGLPFLALFAAYGIVTIRDVLPLKYREVTVIITCLVIMLSLVSKVIPMLTKAYPTYRLASSYINEQDWPAQSVFLTNSQPQLLFYLPIEQTVKIEKKGKITTKVLYKHNIPMIKLARQPDIVEQLKSIPRSKKIYLFLETTYRYPEVRKFLKEDRPRLQKMFACSDARNGLEIYKLRMPY